MELSLSGGPFDAATPSDPLQAAPRAPGIPSPSPAELLCDKTKSYLYKEA